MLPEQEVDKILDFAEYLKDKRDKSVSEDLTKASESSLGFLGLGSIKEFYWIYPKRR